MEIDNFDKINDANNIIKRLEKTIEDLIEKISVIEKEKEEIDFEVYKKINFSFLLK